MNGSPARAVRDDDFRPDPGLTAQGATHATGTRLTYDQFWRHFSPDPSRRWEVEAVHRLLQFAYLPEGWDGYGGTPLKLDVGFFALNVINNVMRPLTPMPQFVPTASGGVQFEWHEKGIDLEFHITGPYDAEMWFQDRRSAAPPVSLAITNDLSELVKAVDLLTQRG